MSNYIQYQNGFPHPIRCYFDWQSEEFHYLSNHQKLLDIGYLLSIDYDVRSEIHDCIHGYVSIEDVKHSINILISELYHSDICSVMNIYDNCTLDQQIDHFFNAVKAYYNRPTNNMKGHYVLKDNFDKVVSLLLSDIAITNDNS